MSYYGQGPPAGPPYQQAHTPHQGNHPPPLQGYGQPPPMNQYPPQQGYGGPPPPTHAGFGQGPYPPQGGGYAGPPPPQQGYGPPGGFGASPPPGQYGGPPPGQYAGPPPGQYGALQPGYGAPSYGPPSQPSPGYVPGQVAPMDMSHVADQMRSAMKGLGTDEKALIAAMAPLDPLQMVGAKQAFQQKHRRDLMQDVEKETSGYFREGLLAIARGPLEEDVFTVNKAIKGLGTKESMLNDVLLGRSNADLNAIKQAYHHTFHRTLESDVKGDLSLKTERLFDLVLGARRNEESHPVLKQEIDAYVSQLHAATEGARAGSTDQLAVSRMLATCSDAQLRKLSEEYHNTWQRSLEDQIQKSFSGHLRDALLHVLRSSQDRAKFDAEQLEAAMKGAGTKDQLLVQRVVRVHWDRARMEQCKRAYRHFYKTELVARVQGETSGDYRRLMVACVGEL